jgi:Transposase DDE domain
VGTGDGPRQRTLCYLGELNGSAQARWLKSVEVFNEQGEAEQLKLFPSHIEVPEDDPQVARVLVNRVRLERTRQFGGCFLGWELWKRLGLDGFFEQALDEEAAEVPWSRVAAVLAINRLCAPGSELAIEQRWYPSTALDDLLEIEEGKINDSRLYRCLDRILPHKTKLEQHLKQRYGELFGAEFDVLLYDLTSTYVEGAAEKNPMMSRGYSRDHRPDCEQMVIALIVNREGFPFSYETFDGNRADVSTMESILRTVERKYGKARRIWVMDRGIVSEENLAAIRKRGGQYLVGTPRRQMKRFEAELLKDDWTQVRADVEVKQIAIPQGEETYILCRTAGRKEKEKAIRTPIFLKHGKGSAGSGEEHCQWPTEGSIQDGAQTGADSGTTSASKRPVRGHTARHVCRRASAVGNEKRPGGVARLAGRRLHAADQPASGFSGTDVVHVHATHRSGSIVSSTQE